MSEFKVGDLVGSDKWSTVGHCYGLVVRQFETGSYGVKWDGSIVEDEMEAQDLFLVKQDSGPEPTDKTETLAAYRAVNQDLASQLAWAQSTLQIQGKTIVDLRRELEDSKVTHRVSERRISILREAIGAIDTWRDELLASLRNGSSPDDLEGIIRALGEIPGLDPDIEERRRATGEGGSSRGSDSYLVEGRTCR